MPWSSFCRLPDAALGHRPAPTPPAALATVARMLSVTELETIAARGWQGTTTGSLGQWLLRAGGGFTGRANSVLPLGSPEYNLDQALVAVADFYCANELPPLFQIPLDTPGSGLAELDTELRGRGWLPYNSTLMMIGTLQHLLDACPPSAALPRAVFDPVPSAGWLAGYHYRGKPLPSSAIAVLVNADSPVFASIPDSGCDQPQGVARGIVTDGWLGVTAVTVPSHRRRSGVGTELMGELARWAAAQNAPAHSVYLQVDESNTAAVQMYLRLGFTAHHRYHYLAAPLRDGESGR
jgi:GNAT superfamily N-acetyltransferase